MFLAHTSPAHAPLLARAVVTACRGDGWQSALQPRLLHTLFNLLLQQDLDFNSLEPVTRAEVAAALSSSEERLELIQLMCAMEILCSRVPQAMEAEVESWAEALEVDEPSLLFLRDLALGQAAQAQHDFYRLNWIGDLDHRQPEFASVLERLGEPARATTLEDDDAVFAKWRALENCKVGSLGRCVADFYQARNFGWPGRVGSANEAVAQHDWIHVLSDYGTTPLGEIEVVSFQASCSQSPGATLGVIGAIGLFESGAFTGSHITGPQIQQGLSKPGGLERMADAIRRGKACNTDLLAVDFFRVADGPIEKVRAEFGIPAKSEAVSRWDPDGVSLSKS
jgi:hypothetical protein